MIVVEAPEGGGILVLLATTQAKVDALDLVGEPCNLVVAQGKSAPFDECLDDGNDHGR